MIRRSFLVAGALAAAALMSSCSTFTANNDVATVGDTSLSRDDFQAYLGDLLAVTAPSADQTTIAGDNARQILSQWVGDQLIIQFLESEGVAIADAERADITTQLDAEEASRGVAFDDATRRIIIDGQAARATFESSQQPGALGPFAQEISVQIDSRYGVWDGQTGSVVAFG